MTLHYAVQMDSIDEILGSTLKINSADFSQTYFLSKYWWKYLGARPGQARLSTNISYCVWGFCAPQTFHVSFLDLPGHKIKQIAKIEFEEADGGREVGYFCVVVTVSVVQVC